MTDTQQTSIAIDPLDVPIWGCAAIGAVVGLNERQTRHMLDRNLLPGKNLGGRRWVSTRRQLLAVFQAAPAASTGRRDGGAGDEWR